MNLALELCLRNLLSQILAKEFEHRKESSEAEGRRDLVMHRGFPPKGAEISIPSPAIPEKKKAQNAWEI